MFHTPSKQFDRSRILSHSRSGFGQSMNGGLTLLETHLTNTLHLIRCELLLVLCNFVVIEFLVRNVQRVASRLARAGVLLCPSHRDD